MEKEENPEIDYVYNFCDIITLLNSSVQDFCISGTLQPEDMIDKLNYIYETINKAIIFYEYKKIEKEIKNDESRK